MGSNIEYLSKIKNTKKKAVTITIDETVIDELTHVAEALDVNRNQIINDLLVKFNEDYNNLNDPDYYIINTNLSFMKNGHLHMLLGNRASAWGETKHTIEGLKPGDYIFVYMNGIGIIGSGVVKSEFISNDYCRVESNENGNEVWDEYFVIVDYDRKSLKRNQTINNAKVVKNDEFKDIIGGKPLGRTKISLRREEGEELKSLYHGK